MCMEAMKRKFILFLFILLPLSTLAIESVNIGFENGLSGWKCYTGNMGFDIIPGHHCYQTDKSSIDDDRLNWVEQVNVPMDRFKLMNNSNDVDGICNVISLSTKMGNGFLKLGDSDKGRNCEKVSYTFAYDESKRVIKYAYMNFNINLV